jgi:HEAT repeat protein
MTIDHNNILVELNKAVKTLHFYPSGHPNLDAVLQNTQELMKQSAMETGGLKWKIDKKGIYADDKPISPGNPSIAALAKQLFLRKVSVITFTPDITLDDLKGFISALTMEPSDIFKEGGVEKVLARRKVHGILLNEMSYEDIAELEENIEEEEDEEIIEEEPPPEEEPPMPDIPPEPEGDSLSELLTKLTDERDPILYNDLAAQIMDKAVILLGDSKFDELFDTIYLLCWHSISNSGLSEELNLKANECLSTLLTKESIQYLITRLGERDEPKRAAIEQILFKTGTEAIEPLLNALIDTHEAHSRRHIFNTTIRFSESIRTQVVSMLADERWFVVRQMVSILGELGGEHSLDPLEAAYSHGDIRVKKEVLKSLARIPSARTSAILIEALQKGDADLHGQAIISLGILKDTAAIDTLGEIASKKEAFDENFETRKEAIKALGMIGSEATVPHLEKVLLKKVWFGKNTNEDIRTLAALSLAKVGGEDALDAIAKAYKNSKGTLYNTCKRILEGAR